MAIEIRMRAMLITILVLSAAVCWASDSAPDWHMTRDARAHALFCKSAFVHGYMHGYEEGFHVAGLDLNFGRSSRDPEKLDEYRRAVGYQRPFGDRHLFESGYRDGFRVGYSDGMNQRAFRAVDQARAASVGLAENGDPKPNHTFDQGFSVGYLAGSGAGLRDVRSRAAFRGTAALCQAETGSTQGDEYCAGYARGYRFGYSDAYITQAVPSEQHRGKLPQLPASVFLQPGTEPPRN